MGLRQRLSSPRSPREEGVAAPLPLGRRLGLAGPPERLRSCSFCFSSFFTSSCSFRTSASAFTLELMSSMAAGHVSGRQQPAPSTWPGLEKEAPPR